MDLDDCLGYCFVKLSSFMINRGSEDRYSLLLGQNKTGYLEIVSTFTPKFNRDTMNVSSTIESNLALAEEVESLEKEVKEFQSDLDEANNKIDNSKKEFIEFMKHSIVINSDNNKKITKL